MEHPVMARGLTKSPIAESSKQLSRVSSRSAILFRGEVVVAQLNQLAPMATFAAQLKDMFFGLVERVTGYGRAEDKDASCGQEPTKLASAEVSRTEEVIVHQNEIRSRSGDPVVSGGSKGQINANGI